MKKEIIEDMIKFGGVAGTFCVVLLLCWIYDAAAMFFAATTTFIGMFIWALLPAKT